jgi:5-methylthioadenosine/S-adenosylhomocysteine deaminase
MSLDALIHNGTLVTLDQDRPVIPTGWIGIRNGRIQAVEPGPPPGTGKLTLDAGGGIVMPGLVNTHTHLPMTLFRGLADDLPLDAWLNEHIFPAEASHITADTVHWGTLLACAEMLLSGTTCCAGGYFLEDAVARALADTGMRAVLAQGVIDFPAPGVPDPAQNIAHAQAYARKWLDRHPRITPSIFCHAPYTCSDDTLMAAKAAADGLGLLFQVHAAETRLERDRSIQDKGNSPVAHLGRLGLLDPRTLLAHCVWLDPSEMQMLAASGCRVTHCPESNMKLASGIAPIGRLMDQGVCVGLGTDGCASNNDLSLFGEMGAAAKLHKVASGDPTVLDAATVLRMATIDGARAIGLDHRIGSLETGKQADIIVLDTHAAHLTPMYHPASHIVYAARGSDVRHVMVDGALLVRDRQLLTIELDAVMGQVNRIARKIQAGQTPNFKSQI